MQNQMVRSSTAAKGMGATAASRTTTNGERLTMDSLGRGSPSASWYAPPVRTFGCENQMLRRFGQPVLPLATHKYKVSPISASWTPVWKPLLIQAFAGSLVSHLPFRARLEVGQFPLKPYCHPLKAHAFDFFSYGKPGSVN